jgi:hypothetical protein
MGTVQNLILLTSCHIYLPDKVRLYKISIKYVYNQKRWVFGCNLDLVSGQNRTKCF